MPDTKAAFMLFEEAQGLTEEMVLWHVQHTGWSSLPDMKRHILKPWDIWIDLRNLDEAITVLAQIAKLSIQAFLRLINPRMRQFPSDLAIKAHGGYWLASNEDQNYRCCSIGNMEMRRSGWCFVDQSDGCNVTMEDATRDGWKFWPCDTAANKVPWPEKNGMML